MCKGIEKYNIDPAKSYFIGDRERDMEAASAAGVKEYFGGQRSID